MTAIVGSGDFKFQAEPNWAKPPYEWDLKDVGGVAVDKQDRVLIFNRGDHPMIVLDHDGTVLQTWGETTFNRPTQTALTPNGDILVADGYGNARVHKYTPMDAGCCPGVNSAPIPASSTSCIT
jgi:hypothetical protein